MDRAKVMTKSTMRLEKFCTQMATIMDRELPRSGHLPVVVADCEGQIKDIYGVYFDYAMEAFVIEVM